MAANAANNLADLGVNVLPVGIVGDDEPGRLLLKYFRHKKIAVSGVLKDKSYTTVTKTRILAGMTHTARQQVVRIDREPEESPSSHLTRELYLAARNYAHASDALLVSDYGYGAATPAIVSTLREKGKLGSVPIVLDSRYRMLQYAGVTAATPNEPEVEEALGVQIGQDWDKLLVAGEKLMAHMKLQSLVITRGRDGMVAFDHKPQAGRYSDLRFGSGCRCHRRGRYSDCGVHCGFGGGRNARKKQRNWQIMQAELSS